MNKVTKELDLNKKYSFPEFTVKPYDNVLLAISRNTANWLVLTGLEQLSILEILKQGKSIGEVYEEFQTERPDLLPLFFKLLTQIEAKSFDSFITRKDNSQNLVIYLTNDCNLRCPHCYMYAGDKTSNELTLDELSSLIYCY